jgi:radical SAM protein with 4Fe4S-binding SPASM domain
MKESTILHVPKTAWITVNRICQMRCGWCYAGSAGYKTNSDMNLELAKRLILLIKDVGIKSVVIIGGEPTLWKYLFEFNDFCRELNIKTGLVSNCQRFSSDKFWEKYQQHPSDYVSISLKAFDQDSSILVSNFKNFDSVRLGIQRICHSNKTQVSLIYNSLVEGRLLDMVKTSVDLGATLVRIGICKPISINGEFISTHCVEYDSVIREVLNCYTELDRITKGRIRLIPNIPLCVWPRDFVRMLLIKKQIGVGGCQFQRRSGVVFDVDGTTILCNSMFDCPVGKFGIDFVDSADMVKLLNSDKVNHVYRSINSYPSKRCIECEMWNFCRGGCPIMWTIHKPEDVIQGW